MIKRYLTFLLTWSLLLSTAQAGPIQKESLKTIFDEFQYSLSVEWNQKDRVFYDQTVNKFKNRITVLQSQGLVKEDIVKFVASKTNDPRVIQELENLSSDVAFQALPAEQRMQIIVDTMTRSYPRGANWSGGVIIPIGIAVVMVAAIIIVLEHAGSYDPDNSVAGCNYYEEEVCTSHYDDEGYFLGQECVIGIRC